MHSEIPPTQLLSARQLAEYLEVSRNAALALLRAEVGGPTYTDGKHLAISMEDAESLKTWQMVDATSVPAIQVKVAAAQLHEHRWTGWHRRLDEDVRRDAVSGEWLIRAPFALIDAAFLTTIVGWIVQVDRVLNVVPVAGGRWTFELGAATQAQIDAYHRRRFPTERGSPVSYHGIPATEVVDREHNLQKESP